MIWAPFWCKRGDLIVEMFINCFQPFPVWCWFSKGMRGRDTPLHVCDQKRHIIVSPVEQLEEKYFCVFLQKWLWFFIAFRGSKNPLLDYILHPFSQSFFFICFFVDVLDGFYKQLNILIDNHIKNNAIFVLKSCFGLYSNGIIGLSHSALIYGIWRFLVCNLRAIKSQLYA